MVLDQVIPEVPFPHDLAGRLSRWLDLDERVGQQVVADQILLPSGGDGFRRGLLVPDDDQKIAVG